MSPREIAILISCASIFLFFIALSVMFSEKKASAINLDDLVNGRPVLSKRNLIKETKDSIKEQTWYQRKVNRLQNIIDLTYTQNETPESIMKFELMALLGGLGCTLLLHLVFHFILVTLIGLGITLYAVIMKESSLNSKLKQKERDFDMLLPTFETNMLLGLQAGATLHKSMEMAIKTIPEGMVQIEFKKLLLEAKTYTDNTALPYMNLSKRVHTKDCERFCNIVISGIKNGNSMGDILAGESEYMTQQVLNKIKEQGERNAVKATAISSGLVFLPLIVIFLAPMMSSAM